VLFEKVNEQSAQEQPNDFETTRMRMQLLGLRVAMEILSWNNHVEEQ
jgi:hypothetical protein